MVSQKPEFLRHPRVLMSPCSPASVLFGGLDTPSGADRPEESLPASGALRWQPPLHLSAVDYPPVVVTSSGSVCLRLPRATCQSRAWTPDGLPGSPDSEKSSGPDLWAVFGDELYTQLLVLLWNRRFSHLNFLRFNFYPLYHLKACFELYMYSPKNGFEMTRYVLKPASLDT